MAVSLRSSSVPGARAALPCRPRAGVRVRAAAAAAPQPLREWRVAAAVCRIWQSHGAQQGSEQQAAAAATEQQSLVQQLKQQCSGMAVLLPFASTTVVKASTSTQAEIYFGLAKAVDIYLAILTVRVLLSWFRNIDWFTEPWNTLRQLTDPFLSVFRGIVPPVGGIDLSPMLGFFLLNFGRNMLMQWAM